MRLTICDLVAPAVFARSRGAWTFEGGTSGRVRMWCATCGTERVIEATAEALDALDATCRCDDAARWAMENT